LDFFYFIVRGEIAGNRFGRVLEAVSAGIAKVAVRRIYFAALRAGHFYFVPAFITKYGVLRILMLAVWAFHYNMLFMINSKIEVKII
jgi:hypothetical protein